MGSLAQVNRNFSRHASSYDAAAQCQAAAAAALTEMVCRHFPGDAPCILDLGCGTGLTAKSLLAHYPNATLTGIDLSAAMVERCRQAPELQAAIRAGRFRFGTGDLRDIVVPSNVNLCVSGLAFQWIDDLDALLRDLTLKLPPDALFAFSTLRKGTFSDLHRCFEAVNFPYPGPHLKADDALQSIVAQHLDVIESVTETRRETHESPRVFLRQVQRTGAVNAVGTLVPVSTLRRVIRVYEERFSQPDGCVEVEYELNYFIGRRRI